MMMQIPAHSDTVLVVDDEPDALRMLTTVLERAEMSVLVATSGEAALELLGNIVPDLILMDAVMPGMDGFETTQKIKARPGNSQHSRNLHDRPHRERSMSSKHSRSAASIMSANRSTSWELLARVRVHMAQGRAVQASVTSLDATDRLILATDSRGNLLWCTPRAEQAINRVAPDWRRGEEPLPPEIRSHIERLLALEGTGGSARVKRSGGSGELEMMVVAHYRENGGPHSAQRTRSRTTTWHGCSTGCRSRTGEAQVLLWVSYGKIQPRDQRRAADQSAHRDQASGTHLRQDRRRDPLSRGGCRCSCNRPVSLASAALGGDSRAYRTPLAGSDCSASLFWSCVSGGILKRSMVAAPIALLFFLAAVASISIR